MRGTIEIDNRLISRPVPRLIREIALPASTGFFFHTMFNVIDTYFGGLVSTQALAALSLSFPVFFVIIAIGGGISTGTTALISNALGAGSREEARLLAVQGIVFGILLSVVITIAGVYLSPTLFRILGASHDYLAMCLIYMNTIFMGTVFFMLIYMFNAILVAKGDVRPFRDFLIAGCFLNILFDPWFIYGGLGVPPMGVAGIAVATVVIQVMGAIYLGIKVYESGFVSRQSGGFILHKALQDVLPKPVYFQEIARQGFPASVSVMTVGVGIFVITYFISDFGKEAVAAYGIATRIEQIVLLPTIGLNTAALTLVAQNNGAKRFDRIRQILHVSLRYGGVLMGAGTIAVFLCSPYLMGLFTGDSAVARIGSSYLKIAAFALYAYVILYVNVATLQGLKRPLFAIWIGLFRQIVAPTLVFFLCTQVFHLGLMGIWWGIFSITWGAALFTLFYVRGLLEQDVFR